MTVAHVKGLVVARAYRHRPTVVRVCIPVRADHCVVSKRFTRCDLIVKLGLQNRGVEAVLSPKIGDNTGKRKFFGEISHQNTRNAAAPLWPFQRVLGLESKRLTRLKSKSIYIKNTAIANLVLSSEVVNKGYSYNRLPQINNRTYNDYLDETNSSLSRPDYLYAFARG